MDFHNYGNANPSKYYAGVFTMYNKEKLAELGYEYSLGDIGITNATTMNVTYKDSRVSEYDNQYGHNYKLVAQGQVVDNFLQFDLHNLGTTESGKTISAHVTVDKWHQSHASATYSFRKIGDMGGYGQGVRTTYEFYDEATGQPINLVRMFGIGDIEAGENLGITSNDKVSSIVPIAPRDAAKGYTPGTHGYASVQQMSEKTAWTFGDEHYANANHTPLPGDPVTVGNNNSTPLAQTISIFSGNKLTASWNGAGGGLDLNSRNVLFKEKPEKITDENYPNPKEPNYEKIPDEPKYTAVPDALPEPTAPEAPTLNTITEPVAPTAPGEAPTEPKKPEDIDVSRTIHYHRAYRLKPVTTKWVDEDGNELKTPKFTYAFKDKLAKEQRKLSKMRTKLERVNVNLDECKNYQKQRHKVAKLHEYVSNCAKDFNHKLSRKLVEEYDLLAFENLNVAGMKKNHYLAYSISDVRWSQLVNFIQYKCQWYGKEFRQVDRFYASSKICSECGTYHKDIVNSLSVREWTCPDCGTHHDRDVNAAKNILIKALSVDV
jgi:IS605 OrfB family transposase